MDLTPLLDPRSIAVIGASEDESKFGGRVVQLLRRYEFAGDIFEINSRLADRGGNRFYASVSELPAGVDLAVLAIPAAAAPDALEEALAAGSRAAVIFAGGFAESTADGAELQKRIAHLSRKFGAPVLGPNSQGMANFSSGAIANFSSALLGPRITPGPTNIVSQSGLVGAVILDELQRRGVGVSTLIATGNEAALSLDQVMDYVADAFPETTLLLCLESLREPARFRAALARLRANSVDVALIKIGRNTAGQRAARSHTAAIASDSAVFDAVCEVESAIQVDTLNELADVSMALAPRSHVGYGERVAIVSNSGGVSGLVADMAQQLGLLVPEFSPALLAKLDAVVPDFIEPSNPLDVSTLSYTNPDGFARVLAEIVGSGEVDQLHIHLGFPHWNVAKTAQLIADVEDEHGLPVLISTLGRNEDLLDELRRAGRKTFTQPDALLKLARLLANRRRPDDNRRGGAAEPVQPPVSVENRIPLRELRYAYSELVSQRLQGSGVRLPPAAVVTTPEAAAEAAAGIGFPVVVKLLSDELVHKSDAGGVRLGLQNTADVQSAGDELLRAFASDANPRLLVQAQVKGAELLLAIHRDPQFGPVVILGSGGVYVERIRDTVTIIAPVNREAIDVALRRLRVSHLLDAHRGMEGLAVDAVLEATAALLRFWTELPDKVTTFEINPLLVGTGDQGAAWAVDHRAEFAT